MWPRSPDVSGCTVCCLRLLLWMVLARVSNPQELPTRDTDFAFGIDQRKLFYDNNRIPDGTHVSPYLFFNTTKKYFFLLEVAVDRLELTVSPCASPVAWKVTYKELRQTTNEPYDISNDVESSSLVDAQPPVNNPDVLHLFAGEEAETLRLDAPSVGIYTLEITSTKTDSYVHIFASSSPEVDRFPELPPDSGLRLQQSTKNSFTVGWNASPEERHFGDDIEYCVSINRKRSFQTLCSVLSHLHGDPKPTLPPGSGFGFSSEVYKKRYLKQKAKPISAAKKGSIIFKCVGIETSYKFDNIRKGKGYFVDVFVKNKQSEKSRHYNGIYVKTKRKGKFTKLVEGKIKRVVFTRKKPTRSFLFRVKRSTKDVHLALSTCAGSTNIELKSYNGTLHKSKIKNSEILTLKDLKKGKYVLVLSKSVSRRQSVYISITTKSRHVRLPKLPEDTTVKVFDYLISCNNITVALKGTDTKQTYCLYKTEIPSSRSKQTSIVKKLNQCGALSRLQNNAQKITCKDFKYRNKDRIVLAITVTGLKPDTSYIFDVFVNKGNYFSFPYNSVRTKTSPTCFLPT